MLKVITPGHLAILLKLLPKVSPVMRLAIMKVLNQMIKIGLPLKDLESAAAIMARDKEEVQFSSRLADMFTTRFSRILMKQACQIRDVSKRVKCKQRHLHAVSKQLLKMAVALNQKKDIDSIISKCLAEIETFELYEIDLVFEILGASMNRVDKGDKVKLSDKY